jgi:tRNA (pseudouridine54-N1)-methyltransferase
MRVFVIKARKAPTESAAFLAAAGQDAHVEILAHALMNALFVAKSHRADVIVHLVLESSQDYSRTITFTASELGDLGGFGEQALLNSIARALDVAGGLQKAEAVTVEAGVMVRALSFEHLIKKLAESYPVYLLDRKGADIRTLELTSDACFLLTDHIPMPRKTLNSLKRLGATRISLGPRMLFASQCIVLIHNELDR